MAELLVMRHAKSAWDTGLGDFDRPLAPRGERDRERMAHWLLDHGLVPDVILSSSAERARMTVAAVIDVCAVPRERVEFDRRWYGAGADEWLAGLRMETADRVLICGHNPVLDELVEGLSHTSPSYTVTGKLMTTGAIAHLSFAGAWADLGPARATLHTIARPREL